jgi:hypothetical protein
VDRGDDSCRVQVQFRLPGCVRVAFEETADLHRAVSGREGSLSEFIEALTAEAVSGPFPFDASVTPIAKNGKSESARRLELARLSDRWRSLQQASKETSPIASSPACQKAMQTLDEFERITQMLARHDNGGHSNRGGRPDNGGHSIEGRPEEGPADRNGDGSDEQPLHGTDDADDTFGERFERASISQATDAASRSRNQLLKKTLRALQDLIRLEDEIEIRMGELLAELAERRAWRALQFTGAGHYGEERLGMSSSRARERTALARGLKGLGHVRQAYESGRIGLEAAMLIRRATATNARAASARKQTDPEAQVSWVDHASRASVKRLRDEVRQVSHHNLLGMPRSRPLAVDEWLRTIYRVPGQTRERVFELAHVALARVSLSSAPRDSAIKDGTAPSHRLAKIMQLDSSGTELTSGGAANSFGTELTGGGATTATELASMAAAATETPDIFLRLRLPEAVAQDFLACLESARRQLLVEVELADSLPPEHDARLRPSVRIARLFHERRPFSDHEARGRIPTWVGLLALLEEFVGTWDDPSGMPRRASDAVYRRAGWRCMAPGCTSRKDLEDHHITYRSRGGGDELENRICLCRFHHQLAVHGGLALCLGKAPDAVIWRLGPEEFGHWYLNEMVWIPGPVQSE